MCSKPKAPKPPPPPPEPEKPKPFKHAEDDTYDEGNATKRRRRVGTSSLTIPLTGTGVRT